MAFASAPICARTSNAPNTTFHMIGLLDPGNFIFV